MKNHVKIKCTEKIKHLFFRVTYTIFLSFIIVLGIHIVFAIILFIGFRFFPNEIPGRDTILMLEKSNCQILRTTWYKTLEEASKSKNHEYAASLGCQYADDVIKNVRKYRINKNKHIIYVIGKDEKYGPEKYVILNYKTEKYKKYNTINEIPTNERKKFKDIKKFKEIK